LAFKTRIQIMAVRTKTSDTRLKVKKASQSEGKTPQTGSDSDKHEKPMAKDQDRGLGSAFAYAVGKLLVDSKEMKGSQSAFLGEPSEVLDPKQFSHSLTKQ